MNDNNDEYREWHDAAQAFESSLMILRKDKNGWVIGFSVHPDEAPRALMDAPLGTRFRQVLFEIGDDERPIPVDRPKMAELVEISDVKPDPVTYAGRLCRNIEFQKWLLSPFSDAYNSDSESIREEATAKELRYLLKIDSRRELNTNESAKEEFRSICENFREYQIASDE
jgi:hypothetical protein